MIPNVGWVGESRVGGKGLGWVGDSRASDSDRLRMSQKILVIQNVGWVVMV